MSIDAARRVRLDSELASVRAGARWEHWIERRLDEAGITFEPHPQVPGLTRRPDLRVEHQGAHAYLEATATGGGSIHGHRQATPRARLHDVLMSRLKHKSRAFQGIDGPLVVAVLCIAEEADEQLAMAAARELFAPTNLAGRNVAAVLAGWSPDVEGTPAGRLWSPNPRAHAALPDWLEACFQGRPNSPFTRLD